MKILKGFLLAVIILLVTVLMPGLIDNMSSPVEANDAGWSEDGSEGGDADAFTVLEIVPYVGMGEIGYLVDGEEPINEDLIKSTDTGELSFLEGAITSFKTYTEKPLPSSGEVDSGWVPGKTVVSQNGYFIPDSKGKYFKSSGDNYIRVADGTGNLKVRLVTGAGMENVTGWNKTNKKNVKAYFVYGKPSGVALYNSSTSYYPYSVTEFSDRTGDYDYDVETGIFKLNKGHGRYQVIFSESSYDTTKVYHMTADYDIVDDGSGLYSFPITYDPFAKGNYIEETGTRFDFNADGSNGYIWVQDDTALSKTTQSNYVADGNKIWVRGQKVTIQYEYMYKAKLINNEWFKRYVLGMPGSEVENVKVRVITITPDNLNKTENQHYIDDAGLIYINSKNHNSGYINFYEKYNYEGLNLPSNQKYSAISSTANFDVHDLTWDNTVKVFQRIAGIRCYKAAVVMDSSFYSQPTISNLKKLFIMVNQRNMVDFYNSFMNPDTTHYLITGQNTTKNPTGTTGSFIRPDSTDPSPTSNKALYWDDNTFLPYGLNAAGEMVKFNLDMSSGGYSTNFQYGIYNADLGRETTDLTNNVLVTNGEEIFDGDFIQPLNIPSTSFDEAEEHLSTVNPDGSVSTPDDFTMADLTEVITNRGAGFENVGGVSYPGGSYVEGPDTGSHGEIPPDDGTSDSDIRYFKRILNIEPTADFTASENQIKKIMAGYPIQIVNMTSTQFNANLEDINSRYDMVYMGSGTGRFNQNGSGTDFNKLRDGFIYFTEGDGVTINDGTNNKTVYYRGNDITSQKIEELKSFLNAGFPVVLDSTIYACDTTNKIQNTTNIKDFITLAKTKTINCLNADKYVSTSASASDKISFIVRLTAALSIVRPNIELVAPIIPVTSKVNYVYANPDTDILTIKFKLPPKGLYSSMYTYNAYLYIDENGDGIFAPEEKVNVISNDGSVWEGLRESNYRTFTYKYDMSHLNGVYQWKVIIKRQDNDNIRSILTGYAANSEIENIYVLQITDNDSSAFSLMNRVDYSSSLIYQYAAQGKLHDYKLIFNTMTVEQFINLYTIPYTTATASTTNQLSRYHLLILDNPNTIIPETDGAAQNIRDEIDKDIGVIYTKDALGYAKQENYYNNDNLYSFIDQFTYNHINRLVTELPAQLYIFRNLGTYNTLSLEDTYKTSYLTKANEGAVTRYPYQINQAVEIAPNTYSNDATIDFNLLDNQRLIGWYCLSDSKSPVVRNEFSTGVPDSGLYQGIYSSSPNDVKNNYYLFSNGPTYYSGINLKAADKLGNDNEIKLFVNTIIAAFKMTGRRVSIPPEIEFVHPAPDADNIISFEPDDKVGSDLIMTFKISESLSQMDLNILLDSKNPAGSWNENIYPVSETGEISDTPISIDNTDKVVAVGTYAVKIPEEELYGDPKQFKVTAVNAEGNITNAEVTLKYAQDPVVSIVDPVPYSNGTSKIIYVDFDYNAANSSDWNSTEELRIEFKVEQAATDVKLSITSDGKSLTYGNLDNVYVRSISSGGTENITNLDLSEAVGQGNFALYVPLTLMQEYNSRDIVITATDLSGNQGSTSVTLLRRNLFPLD